MVSFKAVGAYWVGSSLGCAVEVRPAAAVPLAVEVDTGEPA